MRIIIYLNIYKLYYILYYILYSLYMPKDNSIKIENIEDNEDKENKTIELQQKLLKMIQERINILDRLYSKNLISKKDYDISKAKIYSWIK